MNSQPRFTVLIPVFNREREILRAVQSCLAQDFEDFETVVVDDGSSDRSPEVVASVRDERIHLLRHAANRGVCPARNTGVMAARGAWIVLLDSDDELLPDALRRIAGLAASLPASIQRMAFMYRRDDGQLSPAPTPQEGIVDYLGWLDFVEHARLSDALWVTRREAFQHHLFANGRVAEISYQLEFAHQHRTLFIPEILGLVHTDSADRLSSANGNATWSEQRRRAHDHAVDLEHALTKHGDALLCFAPETHRKICRGLVVNHVVAGHRLQAAKFALHSVLSHPAAAGSWAALGMAVIGARATHYLRSCRSRRGQQPSHQTHQEAHA